MSIYKKTALSEKAQKLHQFVEKGGIVAIGFGFKAGKGVVKTDKTRYHATKDGWVKQNKNEIVVIGKDDKPEILVNDLVIGTVEYYYCDDMDPGWIVNLGMDKQGYLPRRKLWHLVHDEEEAVQYFKDNKDK